MQNKNNNKEQRKKRDSKKSRACWLSTWSRRAALFAIVSLTTYTLLFLTALTSKRAGGGTCLLSISLSLSRSLLYWANQPSYGGVSTSAAGFLPNKTKTKNKKESSRCARKEK
jgi:hypothetical protein